MDSKHTNVALLGSTNFEAVRASLVEEFGTKDDDKVDADGNEKNQKIDDYIDEMGEVNYYTCAALLTLDPNQEFVSFRGKLMVVLLPCFQILVPIGMIYYFIVEKDMLADNGFCCNHGNYIFRFTGFVTFMYSGWQIIDGCDDASSKFWLKRAVTHWSKTGDRNGLKEVLLFYMCYASQTLCSLLLLIVTYVVFTNQCDTPLDLLMNCVAINFVLDIDSEWMDDKKQGRSVTAARFIFKQWRDECTDNPDATRKGLESNQALRRAAPGVLKCVMKGGDLLVAFLTYTLVLCWTFCPPEY